MPVIMYTELEIQDLLRNCRFGITREQVNFEVPMALQYAVPEPFVAEARVCAEGVIFGMYYDHSGAVRWGTTVKEGDRINAGFRKPLVIGLEGTPYGGLELPLGDAVAVQRVNGGLEFLLPPVPPKRKQTRSRMVKLPWRTNVLVQRASAAGGPPPPSPTPGPVEAPQAPGEAAPRRGPQGPAHPYRVKLLTKCLATGEVDEVLDGVEAVDGAEAAYAVMRSVLDENPGWVITDAQIKKR